jgi:pre-mRNA-splicing factor ATP-dependent RNA helicase DHX38/PRP16
MASDLDRAWYDSDEFGISSRVFDREQYAGEDDAKLVAKEEQYKKDQAKIGSTSSSRVNPFKKIRSAEQEAWELIRLGAVGLRPSGDRELIGLTEDDDKVILAVRNTLPPFLDGRTIYTQQQEAVSVVKDPTSDIAVLAKEGSAIVRRTKQEQDRSKMRDRFWEISGSRMGEAIGVKKSDDDDSEESDKKQSISQYGESMSVSVGSTARQKIYDQRRSLPVFQCRGDLMRVIRDHQIIVVVGETGSGKTTQLTQYLMEEGYHKYGTIGCTQPRRVAAVSVAKRVSDEVGCDLGEEVGYSIRFEDVTSPKTRIKYMTDGVLLREALNDSDLEKYSVVIMDEAHERSVNTDILFGVLKRVAMERSDFKLIVTSATMDSEKFAKFFKGAPVFTIPGRTYPVETFFSKTNAKDYVEAAVDQALSVHVSQGEGDILIFMTGQDDIEATCVLLAERLDRLMNTSEGAAAPLSILPIYSQLPADLQARIFEPSSYRKVIVATNIAETSLTVDGVRYVIDTGFCKLKVFNPKIGMDTLYITPISRANANQRKGRAGRTGPGMCWRLYTENTFYYDLLDSNIPEIQRTNLPSVVLLLKSLGFKNMLEFDFMDPPPQATILRSMHQLWLLEALDDAGSLTDIGSRMGQFPLAPALARMVLVGDQFGCAMEMAAIVAMLTVPSIFFRPKDRAEESDAAREKFFVPESDHLTLLNVFIQYMSNGRNAAWCARHFIHAKAMKKVEEIRTQILDIMKTVHIAESSVGVGGDWDIVRKAICSCYFHNVAKLKGIGEYVNLLTSVPCHLHPTSALYGLGHTPEYIVYHDVTRTTKEYMQCVTAAEPYWIAEMGRKFFYLRSSHIDTARERERDRETRKCMEQEFTSQSVVAKPETKSVASAVPENSAQTKFIQRRRAVKSDFTPSPPEEEGGQDSDSEAAARRRQRLKGKKRTPPPEDS